MQDERFNFGNRPSAVSDTPRDSKHGTVVDEVGVHYQDDSDEYWKVIQRIEDDDSVEIRGGFYEKKQNGWYWQQNAMMLPPIQFMKLYARAVLNGILLMSEGRHIKNNRLDFHFPLILRQN